MTSIFETDVTFERPKAGQMVLGKNRYYDMDTHKTRVNNNVLVVGASGAGKTRGIVSPNIIRATDSYVISDPKGRLRSEYGNYLINNGYKVVSIDFTNPAKSEHYNPLSYIHSEQDIVKLAHTMIYSGEGGSFSKDPFWDEAACILLEAMIGYLWTFCKNDLNMEGLFKLINITQPNMDEHTVVGRIFEDARKKRPNCFAVKQFDKIKNVPDRTFECIQISATARLGALDTEEMHELLNYNTVNLADIGEEKTAVFVSVSDTDRSLDVLANIFFTQAMNELCLTADHKHRGALPCPVQFILDDFATNVKIAEFPRMISSIRSRGISTMLMVQSEGQLREGYQDNSETIISNCDTYLYLGSNDLDTAKRVSERLNAPLDKVLYMPIGKGWLFRRGERPVSVDAIELEDYEEYMDVEKDLIIMPDIWEFDDEDYIEIESDDFYDDEYYLSGDGPNATVMVPLAH